MRADEAARLCLKWAAKEEVAYATAMGIGYTFRAQQAKDGAGACRELAALLSLLPPETESPANAEQEAEAALKAALAALRAEVLVEQWERGTK